MQWDRMKSGFAALVHAVLPRIDYFPLRFARVVTQAQPGELDIVPDDDAFPPMGGIPIRHGVPGMRVSVRPGSSVLVGYSEGAASEPFCGLWPDQPTVDGGANLVRVLTFFADEVNLGGDGSSTEPTIRGKTYRTAQAQMHAALATTLDGMAAACTGPLAPLATGFTALAETVRLFEQGATGYQSSNAKVR